jgi:hypothetical protein
MNEWWEGGDGWKKGDGRRKLMREELFKITLEEKEVTFYGTTNS